MKVQGSNLFAASVGADLHCLKRCVLWVVARGSGHLSRLARSSAQALKIVGILLGLLTYSVNAFSQLCSGAYVAPGQPMPPGATTAALIGQQVDAARSAERDYLHATGRLDPYCIKLNVMGAPQVPACGELYDDESLRIRRQFVGYGALSLMPPVYHPASPEPYRGHTLCLSRPLGRLREFAFICARGPDR